MGSFFWFVLVLLFLLVNESSSLFLLSISVGDLGLSNAYNRTFQYVSLTSYLLSAAFRAIPFIALAVFAAKSTSTRLLLGRLAIWCLLLLVALFHFYGYWDMQHSLFTSEHTSSTSALAIIFIPIWALLFSCFAYALIFGAHKIYSFFQKRA